MVFLYRLDSDSIYVGKRLPTLLLLLITRKSMSVRNRQFRTTVKLDELKVILGFNVHSASADGYIMSITLSDRRPSYMRGVEES